MSTGFRPTGLTARPKVGAVISAVSFRHADTNGKGMDFYAVKACCGSVLSLSKETEVSE